MGDKTGFGHLLRLFIRAGRGRQAAEADARCLHEAYEDWAYREARRRARDARAQRWNEGHRRWSRVAREIARLEGREIGVNTADRYPG